MRVSTITRRNLVLEVVLFLVLSLSPVHAQLIPKTASEQWFTISTLYFNIHYNAPNYSTAHDLALFCDEVYTTVTAKFNYPLTRRINVVIVDAGDSPNGFAISNYDFVNIEPTHLYLDSFNLRGRSNWLRNVFTHEFTHIVSLKSSTTLGERVHILNPVIYKPMLHNKMETIFALPLPGRITTYWWTEGIAQHTTELLGSDSYDSHRSMLLRTATLEDNLLTADEMATKPALKGMFAGEYGYNQGFAVSRFISRQFGFETHREIAKQQGQRWSFDFDWNFGNESTPSFSEIFDAWKAETEATYLKEANRILPELHEGSPVLFSYDEVEKNKKEKKIAHLQQIPRLSKADRSERRAESQYTIHPKVSPDKRFLAYIKERSLVVRLRDNILNGEKSFFTATISTDSNVRINSFAWGKDSRTIAIAGVYRDSAASLTGKDYGDFGLIDISRYVDIVDKKLTAYRDARNDAQAKDGEPDRSDDGSKAIEAGEATLAETIEEEVPTAAYSFYLREFISRKPHPSIRISDGERAQDISWSPDGRTLVYIKSVDGRRKQLMAFDLHTYLNRSIRYAIIKWLHQNAKNISRKNVKGIANAMYLINQILLIDLKRLGRIFDSYFNSLSPSFGRSSDNETLAGLYEELTTGQFKNLGKPEYLAALKELLELRDYKVEKSLFSDQVRPLIAEPDEIQCHSPAFSPDGKRLALYIYANNRQNIAVFDLDDGLLAFQTDDEYENRDPVFSTDGKELYFSSDRGGIFNIYRIDLVSRELFQITNVTSAAFFPMISDSSLYYTRFSSFGFRSYHLPLKEAWNRPIVRIEEKPEVKVEKIENPPEDTARPKLKLKTRPYGTTFIPLQLVPEFNLFDEQFGMGINLLLFDYLNVHEMIFRAYIDKDQIFSLRYTYHHWLADFFVEAQKIRTNIQIDQYLATTDAAALKLDKSPGFFGKRFQDDFSIGTDYSLFGSSYKLAVHYRDISGETGTVLFGGPDMVNSAFSQGVDLNGVYGDIPDFGVLTNMSAEFDWSISSMSPRNDGDINPIGYDCKLTLARTKTNIDERFSNLGMFGSFEENDPLADYTYSSVEMNFEQDIPVPFLPSNAAGYRINLALLDQNVRYFDELFLGGKQIFRTFRDVNNSLSFPGYGSFSISGERRILLNLHYRLPIYRDLAKKIPLIYLDDMYLELFVDAANAWDYGKTSHTYLDDNKKLRHSAPLLADIGTNLKAKNFIFYDWPMFFFFTIAHGFHERDLLLSKTGKYNAPPLHFYTGLGAGL